VSSITFYSDSDRTTQTAGYNPPQKNE